MTVSSTSNRVVYAGDGVTVAFAVPFPFVAAADLVVIDRVISSGAETPKALGADYAVAGGAGLGGTVTMTAAPAGTSQLVILRATPATQGTDLTANDPLPSAAAEAALDRLTLLTQDLAERVGRALVLPRGEDAAILADLAVKSARLGKLLGFDGTTGAAVMTSVTNPVIDTSVLVVVAAASPGHVNGRLWIDTNTADHLIAKMSDATDWVQLWDITISTNAVAWSSAALLAAANVFTGGAQTVTRTENDATQRTGLALRRARTGATVANDLGASLDFEHKDSVGTNEVVARILDRMLDPASGSEDAELGLWTRVAGALAERFRFGQGLYSPSATAGDKGGETINIAGQFFRNNVALPDGAADAAAMEAASSSVLAVPPGLQHRHPAHPKAWVTIDGDAAPAAIKADYGVSGITDIAAGRYTVTFDVAFSAATYGGAGMSQIDAATDCTIMSWAATPLVGSCELRIEDTGGSVDDVDHLSAIFVGDV